MNSQVEKPPISWPLIILFLIIMVSVGIAGITYYNNQKETLLSEKLQELSAISDLKIRQITQWRFERMANGKFLGDNIMLVQKYSDYLNHVADKRSSDITLQSLKSLTENFDYSSAILTGKRGDVRLSFPLKDSLMGDNLKSQLPGIELEGKVVMTDLYIDSTINYAHLDLIVPLIDRTLNDTLVQGLLVLRIDPKRVLYPMIQSWPTPSRSAETLIVRKEGDEIVYLNELRHQKGTELSIRKPDSEVNLPAAMAFRGIRGTIDGIDYRNVRVVASMKKIPGTQWFMVAKIDREEIFSILSSQTRLIFTVLVLFMATVSLFLGFILWKQRVRFYREMYESELNRLALFKHFDYILKFANDIILLLDRDLNIVEANDRALEVYMYNRGELIGKNIKDISAPEALSEISRHIDMVNENGSATFETIHRRRDNTVLPVEMSSRKVDIEGSLYYQNIGRDITERRDAEKTLRDSELRFRKIFEESPFPMVITGKDFGILRANASFCSMTGYSEEELKMISLNDLMHPEDASGEPVSILMLIAEEIPVYHKEKRYLRKDGSEILGSSTISIIHNSRDEAQIFLCMVEDITLRKKTENDLIAAKLKAEESDRLKTAFLHNISHEIRTPMNAIIGFSSLLNEPDLNEPDRQQYTEIIFQSSNQLLSIINDIVDIANIESGQVKVRLARTDLNFSLRSLDGQFSYSGKHFRIPITLLTGLPDEKAIIMTDNTKLIQILSNLINNSIKFTRKGSIDFGYELKGDFLEFFVRDTGIGIPPDSLSKIFDRFYQVDRTVSRQFGGTGLGLSICKAYTELLGGTISVTSEPEKGTVFFVTIPYIQAE
jgi:PAS domain S-box-containing protein